MNHFIMPMVWLFHGTDYIIFITCPSLLSIYILSAAAAKSLQSCPTLCNPIDGSPAGSAVPGILQARTLELVAISFSNAWKWKVKGKSLSRVWLFVTPWTSSLPGSSVHGIFQARVLEWGSTVLIFELKLQCAHYFYVVSQKDIYSEV